MRWLLSSHGAGLYGAERVLLALSAGLARRGHEVTLEVPHDGPLVERAGSVSGVELWLSHRARLPRNVAEAARYLARAPADAARLRRGIRDGAYDVVWVNSMYNPFAAVAARLARVPVVWHLHERSLPVPAGSAVALAVAACADSPVAISGFVAGSFARHWPLRGRLQVLPNPLLEPIPPAPLPAAGGSFTIGYVGQFEPRKRPWDVVRALASVPDAEALLVGDGKAAGRLEGAVARHGVADRVRLPGFQADVRPFLTEMDCVVIPSRAEPFGLVALEAMAAGRPVIAAASGALPEVLGDAALFYPLGDTAALAAQIGRLRGDPALAARLRERGLRRVATFSLDRWIDGAEAIGAATADRTRHAHV